MGEPATRVFGRLVASTATAGYGDQESACRPRETRPQRILGPQSDFPLRARFAGMTGPLFGSTPSTGVSALAPSGPADAAQAGAILFLHSRESVPVLDELSDLGDSCLR